MERGGRKRQEVGQAASSQQGGMEKGAYFVSDTVLKRLSPTRGGVRCMLKRNNKTRVSAVQR